MLNGLFAIAAVGLLGIILAAVGTAAVKLLDRFLEWYNGRHQINKLADHDRRSMRHYWRRYQIIGGITQ